MSEYDLLLTKYSNDSFSVYFDKNENWGDLKKAQIYLSRFWLNNSEYNGYWLNIQKSLFPSLMDKFPNIEICKDYSLLALRGGILFTEEDFLLLKQCIEKTKDKYFVVLENQYTSYFDDAIPPFRMKYPSNISWDELNSGNFISSVLCSFPEREYFVFGDSCLWLKYSANDYIHPLDFIGYKNEVADIFIKYFQVPDEERKEIFDWLPENYKLIVK